jgi:hypothetical protein
VKSIKEVQSEIMAGFGKKGAKALKKKLGSKEKISQYYSNLRKKRKK